MENYTEVSVPHGTSKDSIIKLFERAIRGTLKIKYSNVNPLSPKFPNKGNRKIEISFERFEDGSNDIESWGADNASKILNDILKR